MNTGEHIFMQRGQAGILYIVATPIGNLQDITLRAVDVLKRVDKIAAEDTRHSAQLLKHYGIQKPSVSLHNFNEQERVRLLVDDLKSGQSIALISDAGTPLISDPGYKLVREAKASGVAVVPVPGACAAVAALCASGLPSDRFVFEGFLPAKEEARRKRLAVLAQETRTLIFYEAPHRLIAVLKTMIEVLGVAREAVIARELSKIHESIRLDTLQALLDYYQSHPEEQRGEVVLLVKGVDDASEAVHRDVVPEQVLMILLEELPLKQAVLLASKITGVRKNALYELALKYGSENRGE